MPEYSLNPLQDDCYENSTILKNNFNIHDAEKLDIMERSITSMLIAKAMIEIPFKNVDFEKYFINLMKKIDGLNTLLFYPVEIIAIMSLLQAALNETSDLNYLHPFREGNGRIQRLFLLMLVNSLGKSLNFSQIDADYLMIATIKSVSGDIFMLRDIFREYIAQN